MVLKGSHQQAFVVGSFEILGFFCFFGFLGFLDFLDFLDLFGEDGEGDPMNPHTEFSQPPQDSFGIP